MYAIRSYYVLRAQIPDSVRVHALTALCAEYRTRDLQKSLEYGEQALRAARRLPGTRVV